MPGSEAAMFASWFTLEKEMVPFVTFLSGSVCKGHCPKALQNGGMDNSRYVESAAFGFCYLCCVIAIARIPVLCTDKCYIDNHLGIIFIDVGLHEQFLSSFSTMFSRTIFDSSTNVTSISGTNFRTIWIVIVASC